MKTPVKVLAIALAATLTGCAATPAVKLSDAQLCAELGAAQADADSSRLYEVIQEGKRREDSHTLTVDQATCENLAQTGAIERQNYRAQQRQMGQMLMQYGQQVQQQQAQQDTYNQQQLQQMNQNLQAQQNTRALNNIASAVRGY